MKIYTFTCMFCILLLAAVYGQFPPVIDLGNFQEDVRIISSEGDVLLGSDLATGDLNNDGFDDLIIGAYGASGPDGLAVGNVYIVFGKDDLFPAFSINRPTENITIVYGDDEQDLTGLAVECADINNDGYIDVIIGAPQNWKATVGGYVYIIWGRSEWPQEISLNTNGGPVPGVMRIRGKRVPGVLGTSLATGDVNGDGFAEVVMGDFAAGPPGGRGREGEVYVLYGGESFPEVTRIDSLAERMTTLRGVAEGESQIGKFVGCLDIDEDGYWDILVGDPSRRRGASDWRTGRVYIIYGMENMPRVIDLDSLSNTSFEITQVIGEKTYDYFGWGFAGGDFNGDGYQDLFIGTREWIKDHGWDKGKMYVLFGPLLVGGYIDMRTYADKMTILGPDPEGSFGSYLASGDVNLDGMTDIVVGAPIVEELTGKAWVIFGREEFPAILDLKRSGHRKNTTRILAYQTGQGVGRPVETGDINGDGIADIIISAEETETPSGFLSGEVYIIYGRPKDAPPPAVEKPHLLENYPNPFNGYTVIPYQLEKGENVTLKIYNSLGQEVRTLVDGWVDAGVHKAVWDGYNNQLKQTGNGIYFCRLKTDSFNELRKILYMK